MSYNMEGHQQIFSENLFGGTIISPSGKGLVDMGRDSKYLGHLLHLFVVNLAQSGEWSLLT